MIDLPNPLPSGLRLTLVPVPRFEGRGIDSVESLDRMMERMGGTVLPESTTGLKVTIAFTDNTRHAPDNVLVPALLRELERRGTQRSDVTLVAATGLHRPMRPAEIERKLGAETARSVRVVNHDAFNSEQLVDMGTVDGMPVIVNRLCVECDLLLATGIVEPHQYAGWSGGMKTVVIGCGGERTIAATHSIATLDRPGVRLGAIAGNPFQQFVRDAGDRIGVNGVINALVEEDGTLIDAVFGSPTAAQDLLIEHARRSVLVRAEHSAHIAIAGVPEQKGVNLYQATRAATYLALTEHPPLHSGAPIILPADIPEGVGEGTGERRFGEVLAGAGSPRELIERARREGLPAGAQRAYMVARLLAEHPVIVAGEGSRELIERCHMHSAPTLSEALELAERMAREQFGDGLLDLLVVVDAITMIVSGE